MMRVTLWRWRLHNKTTGRSYISHNFMTEAEALAKDALAVRIEWLKCWKWVPEPTAQAKKVGNNARDVQARLDSKSK